MTNIVFFISGSEIAVVFFIVLLIFGADKVPEIARTLGKTIKSIREATDDIKYEITKESYKVKDTGVDLKNEVKQQAKSLEKEGQSLKEDIEEKIGPIKRQF
ncbi:twin-arginine translocase TatA/TatE family subunit [Flavobacterium sp. CS20]|uniref:Sec-independent protein translocase subunit TatA/TatB n=1 Tax=Flavobacterium sp. CS20 TaxID=2775246 RepID=UPI001B3A1EA9|nr:twin-arginine translocase TatA/TatE family subunit [Flavobacterium sp. CS20]QTY26526.1 twin-arginine translocase TatA/TatE family subunit [Flavobacterium sp. CS20]